MTHFSPLPSPFLLLQPPMAPLPFWFFFFEGPTPKHGKKQLHMYTLEDERLEPTAITHLERNMIFQTSMIMFHVNLQGCTWRIIPLRKSLITTIYTPFKPFGRGTTLLRGLPNHGYYPLTNWDGPPSRCSGLPKPWYTVCK